MELLWPILGLLVVTVGFHGSESSPEMVSIRSGTFWRPIFGPPLNKAYPPSSDVPPGTLKLAQNSAEKLPDPTAGTPGGVLDSGSCRLLGRVLSQSQGAGGDVGGGGVRFNKGAGYN